MREYTGKKINVMSTEKECAWICHSCRSKRQRTDNFNTPVRFTQVDTWRKPGKRNSSESDNSMLNWETNDLKQTSSSTSTFGTEILTIIKGEIQLAVKEAVKSAFLLSHQNQSFFSKEFEHIKLEPQKLNDLNELNDLRNQ